jgi:hypothetical protein
MSNRIVVIFQGNWGSFVEDHMDEYRKTSNNKIDYITFIKRKVSKIGLKPMRNMDYEVVDEHLFMLGTIQYGIKSHGIPVCF